jgi:hypothetical protein
LHELRDTRIRVRYTDVVHGVGLGVGLIEQGVEKLAADPVAGGPVGEELEALIGLRSRLDAQIARRMAAFDASCEWADDGHRSAAAWTVARCRLHDAAARRIVRVARQVRRMPLIADAWERGTINTGHAEVLARVRRVTRADGLFAEFEATFTDVAEAGRPEDVEAVARQWRDAVDAERAQAPDAAIRQYESRGLDLAEILDGVTVLSGQADAIGGAIIRRAVEREVLRAHKDDGRTPSQERVDAMVAICNRDLAGQTAGGNMLPHVSLYTDEATLRGQHVGTCETDRGVRVSPDTARRVACDALVSRLVVDAKGEVLDLGRAVRTFTLAQRRAIVAQYPTCVGVGCNVPSSEARLHHEWWWDDGGPTDLANAVPLCGHEHWLVHEGHWRVARDPDTGIVTWYRPDGRVYGHVHPRARPAPIPIRRRE